jgi:hypothetical protein
MKMEKALITTEVENMTPAKVFEADFMNGLIDEIKEKARSHKPDLTTKKGRDAIKSNAHAVARSKTFLDNLGKGLTKEWKEKAKAVDVERQKMRIALDDLKAEVKEPLVKFEAEEEARKRAINDKIETIMSLQFFQAEETPSSDEISSRLKTANEIIIDESYQELASTAEVEKSEVIRSLEAKLEYQLKYEADQAELERLKAEAAERDRLDAQRRAKEEEERKAKEAKAKKEQEEKDRLAREEQIRKDAEEKAKREAEEIAKAKEEQLERERLQAIMDKEEAERKAKEAAQAERDRIAKEQAEKEAEDKKRFEDEQHRKKIESETLEDLMKHTGNSVAAMSIAKKVLEALKSDQVRHVRIEY